MDEVTAVNLSILARARTLFAGLPPPQALSRPPTLLPEGPQFYGTT
jgi:hypothetical protein